MCACTDPKENEFPSWNCSLAFMSPFSKLKYLMNASSISSKNSLCLLCQIKAERKYRETRKRLQWSVILMQIMTLCLAHCAMHPNIRHTVREKSLKGRCVSIRFYQFMIAFPRMAPLLFASFIQLFLTPFLCLSLSTKLLLIAPRPI